MPTSVSSQSSSCQSLPSLENHENKELNIGRKTTPTTRCMQFPHHNPPNLQAINVTQQQTSQLKPDDYQSNSPSVPEEAIVPQRISYGTAKIIPGNRCTLSFDEQGQTFVVHPGESFVLTDRAWLKESEVIFPVRDEKNPLSVHPFLRDSSNERYVKQNIAFQIRSTLPLDSRTLEKIRKHSKAYTCQSDQVIEASVVKQVHQSIQGFIQNEVSFSGPNLPYTVDTLGEGVEECLKGQKGLFIDSEKIKAGQIICPFAGSYAKEEAHQPDERLYSYATGRHIISPGAALQAGCFANTAFITNGSDLVLDGNQEPIYDQDALNAVFFQAKIIFKDTESKTQRTFDMVFLLYVGAEKEFTKPGHTEIRVDYGPYYPPLVKEMAKKNQPKGQPIPESVVSEFTTAPARTKSKRKQIDFSSLPEAKKVKSQSLHNKRKLPLANQARKKQKKSLDLMSNSAFLSQNGFSHEQIKKILKTPGSDSLVSTLSQPVYAYDQTYLSLLKTAFDINSLVKLLGNNGANQLVQKLFKPVGGTGAEAQKTYLDRLMDQLSQENTVKLLSNDGANQLVQTLFKPVGGTGAEAQKTYLDRLMDQLGPVNTVKLLSSGGANQLLQTLFKPVGGTGAQSTYLDHLMDILDRNHITGFLQKRGVGKIINLGFEKKGNKYRIDLLRNQKKLEFVNFMTRSSVQGIQRALNNF